MNLARPEAATDEPASPSHTGRYGDPPGFAEPPLLSDTLADCLEEQIEGALGETFPPGGRKPRHDGWGPEEIAAFLRALAASGVVDHAARAVGRSVQSAYNLRNARRGRAFARMWDAVLINRSRARLAGELQSRAIAGCVSVRRKDGEIVSEYHYYDNRLAMSLLTRLDRLAEREAPGEAHLRALSEDLDDYLACVADGGDADAFVEERRPPDEPEPPAQEPPAPQPEAAERKERVRDADPEITAFARLTGCDPLLGVHPFTIEVRDIDPSRRGEWRPDQWIRAARSGFELWLEADPAFGKAAGLGPALCYHVLGLACVAAEEDADPEADADAEIDTSDLDPDTILDWTIDQLARGWTSGLINRLPVEFWNYLASPGPLDEPEE